MPTTATRRRVSPQHSGGTCRFTWCTQRDDGHAVHWSPSVSIPGDDASMVLYAETDPDTTAVLYGPVLGGSDDADRPASHARVLAAVLRVSAARLDELATLAEAG